MAGFVMAMVERLGMRAAAGCYVGEYDGALLHVSGREGPPPVARVAVTVRSSTGDLPGLDGPLADLLEADELTLLKGGGSVDMEIRDPDSYDGEALATAVCQWVDSLRAAGALPQPKCDTCMVRDRLTPVPRGARTGRACGDCMAREEQTAQAAAEPDNSREEAVRRPTRASSDDGMMMYLVKAAIYLPISAGVAALIWFFLWGIWDNMMAGMADAEGNVRMSKIVVALVGAVIGSCTAIPLMIAIRSSRVYSFVSTWVPAALFGLGAVFVGELMDLLRVVHDNTGTWEPLAVLHIGEFWMQASGFYLLMKALFAGLTVYLAAKFSDPLSD